MTTTQPSLFDDPDPDEARRARDEAIALAASGSTTAWRAVARGVVRSVAASLADFTTDDVLAELARLDVAMPANLSALGPVMLDAAREGEIVRTQLYRPTRFRHRHRELVVWRAAR
jgi:hypothetical protein